MGWKELLLFFIGMVLFYGLGYYSRNFIKKKGRDLENGFGTVEGSLLALFAFFLGFTFSISANKVETIRLSSVQEANAIGTALSRSTLFGDEISLTYRDLFKNYLKSRLDYLSSEVRDNQSDTKNIAQKNADELWNYTREVFDSGEHVEASRLMVPAVNEMFDSVSKRDADVAARLPNAILWMLYFLSFCSCFIVGFTMDSVIWTNVIGFIYIIIVAITVSMIIDASDPLKGFINTNRVNTKITEIYESL